MSSILSSLRRSSQRSSGRRETACSPTGLSPPRVTYLPATRLPAPDDNIRELWALCSVTSFHNGTGLMPPFLLPLGCIPSGITNDMAHHMYSDLQLTISTIATGQQHLDIIITYAPGKECPRLQTPARVLVPTSMIKHPVSSTHRQGTVTSQVDRVIISTDRLMSHSGEKFNKVLCDLTPPLDYEVTSRYRRSGCIGVHRVGYRASAFTVHDHTNEDYANVIFGEK